MTSGPPPNMLLVRAPSGQWTGFVNPILPPQTCILNLARKCWSPPMPVSAKASIQLALALLLIANRVVAADERASAALDWNRSAEAAECLDASALATVVEAGLHRTVFVSAAQADLRIKVSLGRSDQEQWSAAIDLEAPNGKKLGHRELTIRAPQCSAMDESLALVVSLMVDVTRESLRPQPAVVQPLPRIENKFPQAEQAPSPANGWHNALFLLGSTRLGQLPGLGRGISVAGELGPPRGWFALVSATIWAPAQMSNDNSGAKFWLGTAEASLCGTTRSHWHNELSLCVGQQIGLLDSRAFGFDVDHKESAIIYDLTLRLRTTWWATSAFGLHLGLGAALPLVQEEFFGTRADGSTVRLMSRPVLVPLADFGVGLRFGQ